MNHTISDKNEKKSSDDMARTITIWCAVTRDSSRRFDILRLLLYSVEVPISFEKSTQGHLEL